MKYQMSKSKCQMNVKFQMVKVLALSHLGFICNLSFDI